MLKGEVIRGCGIGKDKEDSQERRFGDAVWARIRGTDRGYDKRMQRRQR
jgi:hypothetical protein